MFYLARSAVFIFSSDGKLLQKRETATGSSYEISFGMSDKFFNTFAQRINYEDITPRIRGYLPVPKNPTTREEAR